MELNAVKTHEVAKTKKRVGSNKRVVPRPFITSAGKPKAVSKSPKRNKNLTPKNLTINLIQNTFKNDIHVVAVNDAEKSPLKTYHNTTTRHKRQKSRSNSKTKKQSKITREGPKMVVPDIKSTSPR